LFSCNGFLIVAVSLALAKSSYTPFFGRNIGKTPMVSLGLPRAIPEKEFVKRLIFDPTLPISN
jgi:hypothetical protein